MNTKTITRRGRDWLWPEYDVKLLEAFDDVDNIDTILKYCPNRRVAIQAGGACGVWPLALTKHFDYVRTFEPDPINFKCLLENAMNATTPLTGLGPFALGDTTEKISIKRHDTEQSNAGAGYCIPGDTAWAIPLDTVCDGIQHIDLIQLDVEGWEAKAIWGAKCTIGRHRPTIVIEEKPLPQGGDHLAARRLLESWGYVQRAKVGNDVIFTHG